MQSKQNKLICWNLVTTPWISSPIRSFQTFSWIRLHNLYVYIHRHVISNFCSMDPSANFPCQSNMKIIPLPCIAIMKFDISSKESIIYIWYIIIIINERGYTHLAHELFPCLNFNISSHLYEMWHFHDSCASIITPRNVETRTIFVFHIFRFWSPTRCFLVQIP